MRSASGVEGGEDAGVAGSLMAGIAPTWEPIWLGCKRCGHEWDDWQPQMVPVATWVAHVRTYRCPECGARSGHIVLRVEPVA